MKKRLLPLLGGAALAILMFGAPTLAQAATLTPLSTQLVVVQTDSKSATITVNAAIADGKKLPATVELLAPEGMEVLSATTFDPSTGKVGDKITYTEKSDKSTKAKTVQAAYRVKLTDARGIRFVFKTSSLLSQAMQQHTYFGIGWTTRTNADTLTIGGLAPEGEVGIGSGISLLGYDSEGHGIYGKTYSKVKANTEYILQMGFEKKENATSNTQTTQTKKSFWETKNALLVVILGGVMLIAILLLIIVLIKGRAQKARALEEYDEFDDEALVDEDEEEEEAESAVDEDDEDTSEVDE